MEQIRNLRHVFPTPRLEQVRDAVRARRIASWQATKAAMAEAEAEARASRWIPVDEAADGAVEALGRRIAEEHLVGQPWGRW